MQPRQSTSNLAVLLSSQCPLAAETFEEAQWPSFMVLGLDGGSSIAHEMHLLGNMEGHILSFATV